MNISYKPLSSMSFEDAHTLFNRAFEGYLVPMRLSLDAFVQRFGNHDLSPDLSIAAYDGNEPIGIVIQGIRDNAAERISWNGGTGIISEYRGKKLGRPLIEEAEKFLKMHHVSTATLESISENKAAISLYESCGYQIADHLLFLQADDVLNSSLPSMAGYEMKRVPASQTVGSDLFPPIVPWQTDARDTSRSGGEAVMILKNGELQSACLIQRKGKFGAKPESVTLFQVMKNGNEEALNILLAHALEYDQPTSRKTYNFLQRNAPAVSSLLQSGFVNTPISQVFMIKKL